MTPSEPSRYPKDAKDFLRVFEAAKKDGPQQVFDGEGVFTVSYVKRGGLGSASEFLTRGGPADE